ncbi:MAG: hypothetical protein WA006_09920 [Rhodoglobus sp.]
MTLIEPHEVQSRTNHIAWKTIQPGLWVGHCDGEFAGMIEAVPDRGFMATTSLARELGAFATVAEAQSAFRGD